MKTLQLRHRKPVIDFDSMEETSTTELATEMDNNDESARFVVRTDNGGELAGSKQFNETVAYHGYIPEPTPPDTSSMNGLAERPNRTLKERVRCLLYTAGLGTEFWSDALIHVVWLYNRTIHRSLGRTPYEAYTGKRPLLDNLLTFGCKITPKKTGARTTALDPHHFEGIFLGYKATTTNIKYWDIHQHRERHAHHMSKDELQYGRNPQHRSPGAKHLLEVVTGQSHNSVSSHCLKETPIPSEHVQPMKEEPKQENNAEAATSKNALDSLTRSLIDDSPLPYTAAAAKVDIYPNETHLVQDLQQLDITLNMYEPAVTERLPIHASTHPTLGLIVEQHPEYVDTVVLTDIHPGTIAQKTLRNWRSRLRGSVIRMIDDITITSVTQLQEVLTNQRSEFKGRYKEVKIQFAQPRRWAAMNGEGLPTLAFDQLNVIAHHLRALNSNKPSWDARTPTSWPDIMDGDIDAIINKGMAIPKLTRRKLIDGDPTEWERFQKSEYTQLDKYHKQAHRLTWALIAALNYIAIGADVGNAFAEAAGPKEGFFMEADDAFRDWWTNHLGNEPIPKGSVIPILRNLQGHPEAPRLWSKHIDRIIRKDLGFTPTTHEPCLYFKQNTDGKPILLLRQVDDFLIAGPTSVECQTIRAQIQAKVTNKLNDLGVIQRFNGLDVEQTSTYVKLYCESYIEKIVTHHGWTKEVVSNTPTPMRNDSAYMTKIQTEKGPTDKTEKRKLETKMGFSYRQAIGELIFAMSTCRVDIAAAVILLSQYSEQPAPIHFTAVKSIFLYLYATRKHGLYYWRDETHEELPHKPDPKPHTDLDRLQEFPTHYEATILHGSTDATWANDRNHRRSVSGVAILLAGAVVYYRSRLQPTVALSSTESEFAAMAETGKAALYLRSILDEIGITQAQPTPIQADNKGAIYMANAQQPTKRTKHVDIKQFAILQWTDDGQLTFSETPTQYNISDSLTKEPLGKIKFYEQNDILMGRRKPRYSPVTGTPIIHTMSHFSTHTILRLISCNEYLASEFC